MIADCWKTTSEKSQNKTNLLSNNLIRNRQKINRRTRNTSSKISYLENHLRALCQCLLRSEIISQFRLIKNFICSLEYLLKENPAAVYAKNMSIGGPIIDFNDVVWKMLMKVVGDSSKSLVLVCVQFWLICKKYCRNPINDFLKWQTYLINLLHQFRIFKDNSSNKFMNIYADGK